MQTKYLYLVAFLCLDVFIATVYAAPLKLQPLNCKLNQVKIKELAVVLNADSNPQRSQIYLIKNTATSTITLDHSKKNVGMSAGWSSMLAPGNWSAILISQKDFALQCSIASNKGATLTSCKSLQVCQSARGLSIDSDGNYWLTENKAFNELTEALKQRGVHSAR